MNAAEMRHRKLVIYNVKIRYCNHIASSKGCWYETLKRNFPSASVILYSPGLRSMEELSGALNLL
jgi:hypothetical protein